MTEEKICRKIPVECGKCGTVYEEIINTFLGVYKHQGYWDGLTSRTKCPKCGEINERYFRHDAINELFRRILYLEERMNKKQ